TPTMRPSMLPPTMEKSDISTVRRNPASRKGRFLRMMSGIAEALPDAAPCAGNEKKPVAHRRNQQQGEQGYRDIDLEGAEGLTLDSARLKGEFRHRDHGCERGVLDELREYARKRGEDYAERLRIDDKQERLRRRQADGESGEALAQRHGADAGAHDLGNIGSG